MTARFFVLNTITRRWNRRPPTFSVTVMLLGLLVSPVVLATSTPIPTGLAVSVARSNCNARTKSAGVST